MDTLPNTGLNLPHPLGGAPTDSGAGFPAPVVNSAPPHQPPALQQATVQSDTTDELDKEWIGKAKQVVDQTRHDPHVQSREIGKIRADYLRIRFNKNIKLDPDQTL
ncbi:MAG: hypothetical protein ACREGD_01495 [Candidatus Saccharimonadales bacterium]